LHTDHRGGATVRQDPRTRTRRPRRRRRTRTPRLTLTLLPWSAAASRSVCGVWKCRNGISVCRDAAPRWRWDAL